MVETRDLVLTDVEVVDEEESDDTAEPEDDAAQADSIRWHQVALDTCDDISKAALELKRQMEGLFSLTQPNASDTLKKLLTVHANMEKFIKEQG